MVSRHCCNHHYPSSVIWMDTQLNKLLQDESEDDILARIQEESLRYFNEVELPRRAAEQKEKEKNEVIVPKQPDVFQPQPHCSKQEDQCNASFTPTPATDVFYQAPGQGADGFHLAAGETYVYPTNYPVRQYQKTIIHSALFHNTLVSLPTGLGKTFIAAVVMYNFYRWFPQGKIVFMAPTRPLVAQQIRACHDIMAIPIKDTIEMTGAMHATDRLQHWKSKRVFFLTPQVMANDLRTKACPPACGAAFKCVVIDEAHRATKEYSYCHSIE
ncbi:Fanconi anemia group M protein-like [Macrosteles quadrilineatus]|uniref:Fanconi anemia group M protein-like n=1 Tax=Macrosteles quadrilineatus TaxID=74068 RepID=UPI0023E255B3|nr:Fanconi anemia group M protein-like [Macrosteles quadrilineatus]